MIYVLNKRTYSGPGEYIGRPTPLGNPFTHLSDVKGCKQVGSRLEAVERCRQWLRDEYRKKGVVYDALHRLADKYQRDGKLVLICWCSPEACHGDVVRDAILGIMRIRERNKKPGPI